MLAAPTLEKRCDFTTHPTRAPLIAVKIDFDSAIERIQYVFM
jgi:hypothetical protein